MPVIYKNGQAYGSDEWRSDINTFRSQIGDVIGITKSYTIGPSDWVDGVYTINDSLITVGTNESTQIISYPSERYSDELYYMLANANIRILSTTNGQIKLKAMGILPTNPLPIIITYRVGASPTTLTMDSAPTNGSNNPITSDGVYHAINDATFETGETITFNNEIPFSGFLSNSNKQMTIYIPLPKKSTGNVTVTSLKANVRMGAGGYAAIQSAYVSGGYDYLSYLTSTISPAGSYYVKLQLTFSANQHGTNNQALAFGAENITLAFS